MLLLNTLGLKLGLPLQIFLESKEWECWKQVKILVFLFLN